MRSRPARLTVERRYQEFRCRGCGRLRSGEVRCPEHPEAELLPWDRTWTRTFLHVVGAHAAAAGTPGADPNNTDYSPGNQPGIVAMCELLYADWGRDTLPERRAPAPVTTPLFGRAS